MNEILCDSSETLMFYDSYVLPIQSYYVLSPKVCIVVIYINTQREAGRRVEEQIANVGSHESHVPSQDNQMPPL